MRGTRGLLPAAALLFAGTLGGLIVLEAAVRLQAVGEERRQGRLVRDLAGVPAPRPGSTVGLGQMIRRSTNPRTVYELQPRLDVVFSGGRVTTSDSGFRGADVTKPKPPGVFRIVGIGDSYMFGQGVSDAETYLSALPGLLSRVVPGLSVETVNLAVPGFNTVMEVELAKARAAELEPDIILIEIVGNDLDLPNFLWNPVDPWSLKKSFLIEFARARIGSHPDHGLSVPGLRDAPRSPGASSDTFSRTESDVPAAYASLVGLPAFNRAIVDLAGLGNARGIPVMAMTHGVWFEDDMIRALTQAGIPVLVLRSALRQRARSLGAPDYARSLLSLGPSDLHPSALGHGVIAEELAGWLAREHADALSRTRARPD